MGLYHVGAATLSKDEYRAGAKAAAKLTPADFVIVINQSDGNPDVKTFATIDEARDAYEVLHDSGVGNFAYVALFNKADPEMSGYPDAEQEFGLSLSQLIVRAPVGKPIGTKSSAGMVGWILGGLLGVLGIGAAMKKKGPR